MSRNVRESHEFKEVNKLESYLSKVGNKNNSSKTKLHHEIVNKVPSVKQLTKSQSLTKIPQEPTISNSRTDVMQPEYSPEYSNRNVSVTTAATIDKPSAFQITVSKKPQNE